MSVQNTLALLRMYAGKGVGAVRTPSGVVLMGVQNLTAEQKRVLLAIPQAELDAAIRWQK